MVYHSYCVCGYTGNPSNLCFWLLEELKAVQDLRACPVTPDQLPDLRPLALTCGLNLEIKGNSLFQRLSVLLFFFFFIVVQT